MSAQSRFRVLVLAGAGVAAAAVACGDPYAATNPYDPDVPVHFTITGPDTLFSVGEAAQYTATTVPAFSDTSFVWQTDTIYNYLKYLPPTPPTSPIDDGSLFLLGNGAGSYRSLAPPLEPNVYNIAIAVSVGNVDTTLQISGAGGGTITIQTKQPRHTAYKTVVVTQRLVRIQLRCPDSHSCAPLAAGDSAFIWVDGFDALGHQITALTNPSANPAVGDPQAAPNTTNRAVATYVSRDSAVASVSPVGSRVGRVFARKPGSTWIVATHLSVSDSLQIVVH
jgi:hypothetical protein